MKYLNKVALLAILIGMSSLVSAQEEQFRTIEKGNVLLNPNLTLGWYDYGVSLNPVNILPPVGLNFEYASSEYLSFGIEAEYGVRRYGDWIVSPMNNSYTYEYKALSFRGSFHYLDFLKDLVSDKADNLVGFYQLKLDLYVGASTGIFATSITEKWNDGVVASDHERKSFDSNLRFGYFAGFRYYLSNRFGVFAETGRNTFGWAKIGVTLKI